VYLQFISHHALYVTHLWIHGMYVYIYMYTWYTITNQIHELILEDRRISAKSIAEQLGISFQQVVVHISISLLAEKWDNHDFHIWKKADPTHITITGTQNI
jgi:hypothetical protein